MLTRNFHPPFTNIRISINSITILISSFKSSYIVRATRTLTLSYSQITLTSVRICLWYFPRFILKLPVLIPNLDSGFAINKTFYCANDKTVFLDAIMLAHFTQDLAFTRCFLLSPIKPLCIIKKYPS